MKNLTKGTAIALVALPFLIPGITAADVLVIEPDDYPAGTDISNLYPGVTMTAVFASDPAVYSVNSSFPSTGTRVFGHDITNGTWGDGVWEYLRFDFDVAIVSVSLDFIADDTDENGVLAAYDAGGNLLGSDMTPGVANPGDIFALTIDSPGIVTVLVLGDPEGDINDISSLVSGGSDAWVVDNFSYDTGPIAAENSSWGAVKTLFKP